MRAVRADALFEAERPRLVGLAYRMLGSLADADDVVQEAWLRWQAADVAALERPQAWLTTVTTRLALDLLRSERRRHERERYVGPWLPEPVVQEGPEAAAELADSLTLGFLCLLDQLDPVERAVFILVDVFGVPYRQVAPMVGRSEAACRQLASRSRRRLRQASPRAPRADERRVVDELAAALVTGDLEGALARLAPDVVLVSDGGARRRAARRPVLGADRVLRFMANLVRRLEPGAEVTSATVNGEPGFVVRTPAGVDDVLCFVVEGGRVREVRMLRNPEKLARVGRPTALT